MYSLCSRPGMILKPRDEKIVGEDNPKMISKKKKGPRIIYYYFLLLKLVLIVFCSSHEYPWLSIVRIMPLWRLSTFCIRIREKKGRNN